MTDRDRSELREAIQGLQRGLLEVLATDRLTGRVKDRVRQIASDLTEFSRRLEAAWDGPPRATDAGSKVSLWGQLFDLVAAAWGLITGNADDSS